MAIDTSGGNINCRSVFKDSFDCMMDEIKRGQEIQPTNLKEVALEVASVLEQGIPGLLISNCSINSINEGGRCWLAVTLDGRLDGFRVIRLSVDL